MRTIYFATKNKAKLNSLERAMEGLKDWRVLQVPFDMPELQGQDVKLIALEKTRYAQTVITKAGVVALDAGFSVDTLGGFPGALVDPVIIQNSKMGISKLLKLMEGEKNRKCSFRECLAFLDPRLAKKPLYFTSRVDGRMAKSPSGKYIPGYHWSELSRIFVPNGHSTTLTAMTESEYNEWSKNEARGSIRQFAAWLEKY